MITEKTTSIRSFGGTEKFLKQFLCSTDDEKNGIDTTDLMQGSSVRVINDSKTYLFDEQMSKWFEHHGGCF